MLSKILLFIACIGLSACNLTNSNTCRDRAGNTYTASYTQVSKDNQDPWVKKTDVAGNSVWFYYYEQTPLDAKGVICYVDSSDELWVVFTLDGGSTDAKYINKLWVEPGAFTGVLAGGYGSGGGPKAVVLTRINKETGKIVRGTFLYSILSTGKTNTLTPKYFGTEGSEPDAPIVLYGTATSNPLLAGPAPLKRDSSLTDADRIDGYFSVRYVIRRDLANLLEANGKFRGEIKTNWDV